MTLHPIEVAPIGSRESPAFVDYSDGRGELRMVRVEEFPPSRGPELREARTRAGRSLREGAACLGIRAVDLTGLERGRLTLSDEEWDEAIRMVTKEAAHV